MTQNKAKQNRSGRRLLKAALSLTLTAAMLAGLFPAVPFVAEAKAEEPSGTASKWYYDAKDDRMISLGTTGIANPAEAKTRNDEWTGSYVYYGNYLQSKDVGAADVPLKYRVLDNETKNFNTPGVDSDRKTMLLDCDTIISSWAFPDNRYPDHADQYAYSTVKSGLNHNWFYDRNGVFTSVEKKAIAVSMKADAITTGDSPDGTGNSLMSFAPLGMYANHSTEGYSPDYVFVLDAKEATNASYGYYPAEAELDVASRTKKLLTNGSAYHWWLRSQYKIHYQTPFACIVDKYGGFSTVTAIDGNSDYYGGVSPALNINLSQVIFSSTIPSSKGSALAGKPGAEYKLTLRDPDLSVAVTDQKKVTLTRDAKTGSLTVSLPYAITGEKAGNANRVSVLMLDRPYTEGCDAEIKYYKELTGSYNAGGAFLRYGTASFTLPADYDPSWWVYLVAEDVKEDIPETADVNEALYTNYGTVSRENFVIPLKETVQWHTDETTGRTLCLGTEGIANPAVPGTSGVTGDWTGSYVYFGNGVEDDKSPVRYRVLSKSSGRETGFTTKNAAGSVVPGMLLDAEDAVAKMAYGDNADWKNSGVRSWLMETFLNNSFSPAEKASIAFSTKAEKASSDGYGHPGLYFEPLAGEQLFLLDAVEVTRPSYGYDNSESEGNQRRKAYITWWLRSPTDNNGFSSSNGEVEVSTINDQASTDERGVCPAMNIDQSSVLFSSYISSEETTPGEWGASYKLVVKDPELCVAADSSKMTRSGQKITVPVTVSGKNSSNVTRVSYLVTDKAYNESGARILQYGALNGANALKASGTGTITLQDTITGTWGKDYHIYLIAEDVKSGSEAKETDYASAPVEIVPLEPKAEPEEKKESAIAKGTVLTDEKTGAKVEILSVSGKEATAQYIGTANKKAKSITVPDAFTAGDITVKITVIKANAFKGCKAKTVTIGKHVKKIAAGTFKGSSVKTIIVKTEKLSKKTVKNCLKGCKSKKVTVKVKVGAKKQNKKFVTKYKKAFTKKNVGVKVTVK